MVVKYMHHGDDLVEHRTSEASFGAQCTNHSASSMCSNDEGTLPHAVDITTLEHFNGVQIEVVPERKRIDILIGQSDKHYLQFQTNMKAQTPSNLITDLPGWDLSPAVGALLLLRARARCLP